MTRHETGYHHNMIILGLILLLIGALASISILWTIGIILVIVGVVLMVLGRLGHSFGGSARRRWQDAPALRPIWSRCIRQSATGVNLLNDPTRRHALQERDRAWAAQQTWQARASEWLTVLGSATR